ncbi:pilus assembly protein [Sphingomonas sp. RP10(2022)]|uniref:Pilus assembly protein n=1 Tax=Sphingomonas liriopis TaxID=2949094 RepID=A0A9X2HQ76_9SPHN|nr:TadE/TadG family type IV pilus assembly protein [Sphingomonas liriopis]MCP3735143.1 pilus assembly protein [Sphingomonas liriopis]
MRRRGLIADEKGLALVEFALVLPFMLILYLGSVQLQDGISCNRKVTIATRALADLIAQNTTGSLTKAEIDSSLAAIPQVMRPYSATPAVFRVTQVGTDLTLKTTVQWSRARNGTAYATGSVVNIPAAMKIPGTYFLLAEVNYAYKPPSNFGFIGALALRDSLYMLPRNSNKIDCTDC